MNRPPPLVMSPVLLFSIFFILSGTGWAQQMMDSVDALTAASDSAGGRAKQGDFENALSAGKKALQLAENRYGSTHPSIVPYLENVGTLYRYMTRYAEAEKFLKWGLAIREKNLGPNDPLTAESLDQLACLYNEEGRWREADFFGKEALEVLSNSAVGPRADLCQVLNHLGEIEFNFNHHPEARSFLQRSLKLQEKISGPDPALLMESLNLLAFLHETDRQFPEAESCLQGVLETARKNLPASSVEIGDAAERLADFYASNDNKEKSGPLYQSALKTYQHFVGVNYSYESIPYLQRLAKADCSTGQYQEAKELSEKALASLRETYGPRHPQVAVGLFYLAQAEKGLGMKKEARSHLKESLAILQALFPDSHPLVLRVGSEMKKLGQ